MTRVNILCISFLLSFSGLAKAQEIDAVSVQMESIRQDLIELNTLLSQKNTVLDIDIIQELSIYQNVDIKKNPEYIYAVKKSAEKVLYCTDPSKPCDSREEIVNHLDTGRKKLAKSVVALISNKSIKKSGSVYENVGKQTLSKRYPNICESEPFKNQALLGFCTGFLVNSNHVITAGHCVKLINKGAYAVFDFTTDKNGLENIINASNVFEIDTVIDYALSSATGEDWAVVRLKTAPDRDPLKLRTAGKISDKQDVCVIGHPVGLPMKVACDAIVRSNDNPIFFESNLDTYGGNSGSPVFNKYSEEVEGILVRGEDDFESVISGAGHQCTSSKKCGANDCRGEDVVRTSKWISKIPRVVAANNQFSNCIEGRLYTERGCGGGYFEDGVYYLPK